VGEETLEIARVELGRRRRWSEVAALMQKHVESAGFSVVTQYVGHGIGRVMHEQPQVPNFVNREVKKSDFKLEEGLVLAVEPMVNMGVADTRTLSDHWTVVTRDGLPSVHVEHTFALTREGVVVVTADEEPVPAPAQPSR
jgi:methionyl aminopeptidase